MCSSKAINYIPRIASENNESSYLPNYEKSISVDRIETVGEPQLVGKNNYVYIFFQASWILILNVNDWEITVIILYRW